MRSFNTPVLLLIFNRPENTLQVLNEIKKIKPSKLYISADGPRSNNTEDIENCKLAREIINKIDWDCEIKKNFREENIGCKFAVSSGISWFFEFEEKGIILEDDCIPNSSFFNFCESMLIKYMNDTRVMHIGGTNFQKNTHVNNSYYYSKLVHVWGWATWRRSWNLYDIKMENLDNFISQGIIRSIFPDKKSQKSWINLLVSAKQNKIDTWDFMWVFSVWKNNGISIIPQKNLIKNIGFGINATHTTNESSLFSKKNQQDLLEPFYGPKMMVPDLASDSYTNSIDQPISLLRSYISGFRRLFF